MKLTGKCKEKFEEWYTKGIETYDGYSEYILSKFYTLHPSMQFGVIQDFADSEGWSIYTFEVETGYSWIVMKLKKKLLFGSTEKTRQEARNAAITKFNQMFNEQ